MGIGKDMWWKQGRHSKVQAVRVDCLTKEVEGIFLLHAAGLPDGKQARPNKLSFVAQGTITYFSGLYSRTN
jgi:hypothetical protein